MKWLMDEVLMVSSADPGLVPGHTLTSNFPLANIQFPVLTSHWLCQFLPLFSSLVIPLFPLTISPAPLKVSRDGRAITQRVTRRALKWCSRDRITWSCEVVRKDWGICSGAAVVMGLLGGPPRALEDFWREGASGTGLGSGAARSGTNGSMCAQTLLKTRC